MSKSPPKLVGLGIIGKNNAPLYMCDCVALVDPSASSQQDGDFYGFSQTSSAAQNQSLSVQNQLLMHAALDQVDDFIETVHGEVRSPFSGMPVRKKPNPALGPHYLGILLDLGEFQVHGYITATNIKMMALTKGAKQGDAVRSLLETIHSMWIAYTMNPFHTVRELVTIESTTFDQKIQRAVRTYAGVSTTIAE
ncbi:hypothetical protein FisN_18Lu098 [Fistulifera solaris]|uniref:Trafficking protein particle complex subunit n=1 Tax=Fistulifera solaris TaxID=1519565 RepID=A0A1Z5KEK1_FISSO|nr:hypothetical protein FisN_18Lu098 [Fistulifera solaris]|eukprot:GAX24532.1 hypothetical protein FisN_18Lu098 [Fistulifera solaris]